MGRTACKEGGRPREERNLNLHSFKVCMYDAPKGCKCSSSSSGWMFRKATGGGGDPGMKPQDLLLKQSGEICVLDSSLGASRFQVAPTVAGTKGQSF